MDVLKGSHDLRLPEWGPYTKKYMGISHIADKHQGIRFDLSLIPGFYRRKIDVPNVLWESGYHPWEASADLHYYSHRHELEWKDQVYCDISFSYMDGQSRLVRCEFVNNTPEKQNMVLHYMASLHFPRIRADSKWTPYEVHLPEGARWIDALDYSELAFATPRPSDNLVYDGYFRGEQRGDGYVDGSGIGVGFGMDSGDTVRYSVALDVSLSDAALMIRYRVEEGKTAAFRLSGIADRRLTLEGTGQFETVSCEIGRLAAGNYSFELVSEGGTPVELDGFVLAAKSVLPDVRFVPVEWNPVPELIEGPSRNTMILKYAKLPQLYGMVWGWEQFEKREYYCNELDSFMRLNVHHHTRSVFRGEGQGHYANAYLRPIPMEPGSRMVIYGMVCCGTLDEVRRMLASFGERQQDYEHIYLKAKAGAADLTPLPAGAPYQFSQQLMSATILTNVVYPVYTKRTYIRHNTPGRWWDSLYTWDSGFIGLGLAELSLERAVDCLNAYVTEPGDEHAAFIHHGSPVPVQHYLFLELWNRTQSQELLAYFYPRLRQYYLFLSGQYGSSTTRTLRSNLLKTWDYFYNSGGWDDYPPQVAVHQNRLQGSVAPVSNTAHCIRIAKILRMAAFALGNLDEDIALYDRDIALFTRAIQDYAWDEASGYYGYVMHNENGEATGILRHDSGVNYNMGLDGAYPLVAGICTPQQAERLIGHLSNPKEMWTDIGISSVDRSAPYYKTDGYWNGAVWMPHQWFYWKAMLDWNRPDFARQIADTALKLWKRETEATYHCFEHFVIASGRGSGWHHFGGLSAPVLNWYAAYYRPGRITCGFDVWISHREYSPDYSSLTANLRHYGEAGKPFNVIVTMNPHYRYRALWRGMPLQGNHLGDGVMELTLTSDGEEHTLIVEPV